MTIHSIDGKPLSNRIARIGQLSAMNPKMVFNNLGHHINETTLTECFKRLDGKKALGIDRVTKEEYGKSLEENLKKLVVRIRRGTYRPRAARITKIPKLDGETRPLAISCTEDKLVQKCVANVLEQIYEPLFLKCSFGYRPGLSSHDALRALCSASHKYWDGAVVEIDLRRYFNTIPHREMLEILGKKIRDKRFLELIEVLLKAPSFENGKVVANELGSPQGSILSPLLANIYLHEVVDEWFAAITKSHFCGRAEVIRFADDMVFLFDNSLHADKFFKALPKRLAKYGLELHAEKSQLLLSGFKAAKRANLKGERLGTYKFLGFTCYWGLTRNRKLWSFKLKTQGERLRKALQRIKGYLREGLSTSDLKLFLKGFVSRVKGWVNYHAVSNNQPSVESFLFVCRRHLLRWFRRRGSGRGRLTESAVNALLKTFGFPYNFKTFSTIPRPKIMS